MLQVHLTSGEIIKLSDDYTILTNPDLTGEPASVLHDEVVRRIEQGKSFIEISNNNSYLAIALDKISYIEKIAEWEF